MPSRSFLFLLRCFDLVQLCIQIQQLFLGELHIHHTAHQSEQAQNSESVHHAHHIGGHLKTGSLHTAAADVLAAAAGRDIREDPNLSAQAAVNAFMEEMNSMAASVGMIDAHFVNPDGIHDQQHYMSLYDIALLGLLVYDNPTISKYAALPVGNNPRYTEPAQGETENTSDDAPKQWKNTNELIQPDSVYYCPYATGMKTGQTPNAGSCLLSSFNYKGRVLIIGVFGCEEKDDRFVDTLQLFNEAIGTS